MVKLDFYSDDYYDDLANVLKESGMFDDVWESRVGLNRKVSLDKESIIVALDDKRVIGCVMITDDGRCAFIWRLCVSKNYRKKGIGSMLMIKAEEVIKRRKILEAALLVDSSDINLKEWYSKQSYKSSKDLTLMYKSLNN